MRPLTPQSSSTGASRWLLLAFTLCLCFFQNALAHSSRPRPFRRIGHVSDIKFDLITRHSTARSARRSLNGTQPEEFLPRRLARSEPIHPSDSLRLSFRAFEQTFNVHLEPNEDLVHPDGITVRDGTQVSRIIPHSEVRAYHGFVVRASHSGKRAARDAAGIKRQLFSSRSTPAQDEEEGVVGRAAIVIHEDGLTSRSGMPLFEGTFDWNGNVHYVSTTTTYQAVRSELDPPISMFRRGVDDESIVIHRMSDMLDQQEEQQLLAKRGLEQINSADAGCTADKHDFNFNNRLILTDDNNDEFSRSPLSFFVSKSRSAANLFNREMFGDLLPSLDSSRRSSAVEGEPLEVRSSPSRFSYEAPTRRQSGNDIAGNGANTSYIGDIGSTAGCPTSARVVYLGVAADCSYSGRLNGDENAVRRRILTNMNTVSSTYRSTFNVSLGVVALEVRNSTCPSSPSGTEQWNAACSNSFTLDERLSAFSRWRGTQDGSTGLWHLLTACASGTEVGVAWLGTVCMTGVSPNGGDSVSGTGVTGSTTIESQIMAHEIGHNFGAVHDCTTSCSLSGSSARQGAQYGGATCCPLSSSSCNAGGGYIMNPSSSGTATAFSPCSIGNVCSLLGRGLNTSCVATPGQRATLSTQQCGNGILEPGEECDAGPGGSRCCTSSCRFTSGAVCDPTSSACCTSSCNFASNSTVCRPAVDSRCDVAETCSGTSAECPADVTKPDGTNCASGLQCAAGVCTSRDQQCQQAGASLGLTRACSTSFDTGCSVACRDPGNSASCLVLQQTFVDGTPCRWGGRCQDGECKTGNWQDVFQGWFRDNLRISIPVTIVVGLLILFLLWAILRCIINACRGRGRTHTAPSTAYKRRRGQSRNSNRPSSSWVDPSPWNGPNQSNGPVYTSVPQRPDMTYAPPPGPPPPPPPRY